MSFSPSINTDTTTPRYYYNRVTRKVVRMNQLKLATLSNRQDFMLYFDPEGKTAAEKLIAKAFILTQRAYDFVASAKRA